MHKVFEGSSAFSASDEAKRWCEANGISVGQTQGPFPRGLLFGRYRISKWRGMNAAEKKVLHGTLEGDMRNGPVRVYIKPEYEHLLPAAAENIACDHAKTAPASPAVDGCNSQRMAE